MAPSASIDTTAAAAAAAQAAATLKALPHPKDLSHHYSQVTKNRVQSRIKAFYRFIQTPGISNFSGGECFASVSRAGISGRSGAGIMPELRPLPPTKPFVILYFRRLT